MRLPRVGFTFRVRAQRFTVHALRLRHVFACAFYPVYFAFAVLRVLLFTKRCVLRCVLRAVGAAFLYRVLRSRLPPGAFAVRVTFHAHVARCALRLRFRFLRFEQSF